MSFQEYLFTQARKKSTKINFLGPETARWGGGLPLEGVVAKNFVPAFESLSSLGSEERNLGCPGNFTGMSRTTGGVPKVCAKKLRAHFSFPFHRLLESYFLWILAEKSTVMGRLEGGLTVLQEAGLTVLLVLPRRLLKNLLNKRQQEASIT